MTPRHGVAGTRQARTRHGAILMLTAVMPTMAIIALVPVLPLLRREFAYVPGSAILVPLALAIPALCVALFSPLAGWISDRIGRKRLLFGALIGHVGVALSSDYYLTAASAVVTCIGNGLMLPTMLARVLRRLPPETRGQGTGVWTGASFLAQFVAPILAGRCPACSAGFRAFSWYTPRRRHFPPVLRCCRARIRAQGG